MIRDAALKIRLLILACTLKYNRFFSTVRNDDTKRLLCRKRDDSREKFREYKIRILVSGFFFFFRKLDILRTNRLVAVNLLLTLRHVILLYIIAIGQ